MGTNYYQRRNICDCCHRYEERHIGSSATGWEFSFRAYDGIRSWKQWQIELRDGKIFDENNTEVSYEEFVRMVNSQGPGKKVPHGESEKVLRNFLDYVKTDPIHHLAEPTYRDVTKHWKDEEGYSFSIPEFF